jgi:hypothetical protein
VNLVSRRARKKGNKARKGEARALPQSAPQRTGKHTVSHLGRQPVPLEPHEHLLLHRDLILVPQLLDGRLVQGVVLLQALDIRDETVLLLL